MPETLADYQQGIIRFIAAKLYESGKLSFGQAADISGITERSFAELLGDYRESLLNYPAC